MSEEPLTERITVELGDTDLGRFIHYGSVVDYFDVGLRNVLEAIDTTFRDLFDRRIGLPIVHASCDYRSPMQYGDEVVVETTIDDLSDQSMTLDIVFRHENGEVAADGTLTVSFFDIDEGRGTSIPDDVRSALESVRG